jgi:hypothetical protein
VTIVEPVFQADGVEVIVDDDFRSAQQCEGDLQLVPIHHMAQSIRVLDPFGSNLLVYTGSGLDPSPAS